MASTGLLASGCAADHDDEEREADDLSAQRSPDAAQPGDASVAGIVVQPDAPWATGLAPFPLDGGIVAQPHDAGSEADADALVLGVFVIDGGLVAVDDAAADAQCEDFLLGGIIFRPADSGCTPLYPGVVARSETDE